MSRFFLLILEFTSSKLFDPLVSHQGKRIETDIPKVLLLTLCNLLKIQEEDADADSLFKDDLEKNFNIRPSKRRRLNYHSVERMSITYDPAEHLNVVIKTP